MGGVEASLRVGVQDPGRWYPLFEDHGKFCPLLLRALTTTNQNVTPQSIDTISEDAQLIDVARDSVILVVAVDHLPKPFTDLAGAIMHMASKLSLDGF